MDTSKFYSKKLTELKPLLPYGFHSKIAQAIGCEDKWKVRDAFDGKRKDIDFLKQVYQQALKMSREIVKDKKRASRQVKALKASAKKVA